MNKRITSLLLCFVMVFAIMATAVPASAATITSTQIKVTPDKTTAFPGDTITYSIVLGPVSDMGSMQIALAIPTGLTYVSGSGKLADNLKATLGFDDASWTDDAVDGILRITGYASEGDYESDTDTKLAELQCKVDDGATGDLVIGLNELEFYSCVTIEDHTSRYSVASTPVTITAPPKPATGVSINKGATTIYTGYSEILYATVTPLDSTDTVKWESSKTSVATVDDAGKVTAVAPGTAIITAKAGSKSATCTVTVENAPCTHSNKTTVHEASSTCTVRGWDAYKKCDDCGQLFDTSDNKISAIPFRALADHTGGTATCIAKAVCTVCGNSYGDYATHKFTAETKKNEAVKTPGTCISKAVYYYSCSVCGEVEHNNDHTFIGELNSANHVGGTSTINASEPDHKNRVEGYTGDTKCLGCGNIIAYGTTIAPGAHVPTTTWNSNATYHWKSCTVAGCGVVIDGTKAPHTSTGANVATCQHKAVCDVCNVEYGEKVGHNPASDWSSDASGHWHACKTAGCTEKCDFAAHTPDHEGHATEEYAIKCTECHYIIEEQLHDVDITKFEYDETNHWNTCSSCSEKQNVAAHEFEWEIDEEATLTEKGSKHEECKVCGYKKAAVEIPATGTPTDPTKSEESDTPQTGDNSMMVLWIAMLFVSGVSVAGTTVFFRKRRSTR